MATAVVTISGNVGGEVTNHITPNGHENIKFSVAVNTKRGGEESVAWYRCTAWGGTAKGLTTLAQNGGLASGAQVIVVGTLQPREYEDRNGATRTSLDVNASTVDIVKFANTGSDRRDDARQDFRQQGEAMDDAVDLNSVPF